MNRRRFQKSLGIAAVASLLNERLAARSFGIYNLVLGMPRRLAFLVDEDRPKEPAFPACSALQDFLPGGWLAGIGACVWCVHAEILLPIRLPR